MPHNYSSAMNVGQGIITNIYLSNLVTCSILLLCNTFVVNTIMYLEPTYIFSKIVTQEKVTIKIAHQSIRDLLPSQRWEKVETLGIHQQHTHTILSDVTGIAHPNNFKALSHVHQGYRSNSCTANSKMTPPTDRYCRRREKYKVDLDNIEVGHICLCTAYNSGGKQLHNINQREEKRSVPTSIKPECSTAVISTASLCLTVLCKHSQIRNKPNACRLQQASCLQPG